MRIITKYFATTFYTLLFFLIGCNQVLAQAGLQQTPVTPNNPFSNFSVDNPLNNISDLPSLILAILTVLITISVPIIVIAIVYAGFKYVTARGNANDIRSATQALTYAIIGAVLILGALVISEIIGDTVTSFGT